ncbi:MAG: superoxide dismutase [Clostridia bacterium]|nr:superoxide dismutase [Anaerotignum sp.]NCC16356.1 superoxide dismutase [Clostridia bacterium]
MENNTYPFVNLPLPYDYNALEPYIDAKTMAIHYDVYLQGYIDKLNQTISEFPELQLLTLEELIVGSVYLLEALQVPIQNNAGGIYNHRMYFNGMQEPSDRQPQGQLIKMIEAQYGNLDNFLYAFKKEAMGIFGSGYTWLVFDNARLRITTTANQKNPITLGFCPIMALDVWEHAYFLKHYNERSSYIDDWFQVINWDKANENYMECIKKPII